MENRLAERHSNTGLGVESRSNLGGLASGGSALLHWRGDGKAGCGERKKKTGGTHFAGLKSDLVV